VTALSLARLEGRGQGLRQGRESCPQGYEGRQGRTTWRLRQGRESHFGRGLNMKMVAELLSWYEVLCYWPVPTIFLYSSPADGRRKMSRTCYPIQWVHGASLTRKH
jgi:hypothetical protein